MPLSALTSLLLHSVREAIPSLDEHILMQIQRHPINGVPRSTVEQVKLAMQGNMHPVEQQASDSPKHQTKDKKSVASLPQSTVEAQLKHENYRLKLELARISAKTKEWEELQTLKNDNARLTSELQESTAIVEEMKRQLQALKEEITKMKSKIEVEKDDITGHHTAEQLEDVTFHHTPDQSAVVEMGNMTCHHTAEQRKTDFQMDVKTAYMMPAFIKCPEEDAKDCMWVKHAKFLKKPKRSELKRRVYSRDVYTSFQKCPYKKIGPKSPGSVKMPIVIED